MIFNQPQQDLRYYRTPLSPSYAAVAIVGTYCPPCNEPAAASYANILAPMSAGIVEKLDFKGDVDSAKDPLLGMFAEKTHFSTARIESVLQDIRERYDLLYRNLYELDYSICKTGNLILELPEFRLGTSKDLDRLRTGLEREILRLEDEKRHERVTSWKDIARCKQDLFDGLGSYLDARGATAFLHGGSSY